MSYIACDITSKFVLKYTDIPVVTNWIYTILQGSVSVRFCLHETSFCFVCSHLASGGKEGDERHRNADAAHILARTLFLPEPLRHLPRKILDHEYVYQIYRSDHIVIMLSIILWEMN